MKEIDYRESDAHVARIRRIADLEKAHANLGVSFMIREGAGQVLTTPDVLDHVISVLEVAARLKQERHRMHMLRPDVTND